MYGMTRSAVPAIRIFRITPSKMLRESCNRYVETLNHDHCKSNERDFTFPSSRSRCAAQPADWAGKTAALKLFTQVALKSLAWKMLLRFQ